MSETMYQCYFIYKDGEQCENKQIDYWCSEDHKIAWQKRTYGVDHDRYTRRLSIEDMQNRLKELGREKHIQEVKGGVII